jgi:hypothetical protein
VIERRVCGGHINWLFFGAPVTKSPWEAARSPLRVIGDGSWVVARPASPLCWLLSWPGYRASDSRRTESVLLAGLRHLKGRHRARHSSRILGDVEGCSAGVPDRCRRITVSAFRSGGSWIADSLEVRIDRHAQLFHRSERPNVSCQRRWLISDHGASARSRGRCLDLKSALSFGCLSAGFGGQRVAPS